MQKQRLIFFGNERLATSVSTTAPTLRALIAAGYDIAAVVSKSRPVTSRKARPLEVEAIATEHDIPLLLPDKPREIMDQLTSVQATAAVLVAYGRIIPQDLIDLFPRGIINVHPSLLPLHRGPIPLEQVILDGANETGVSIMQLSAQMDAGPVFAQVPHTLTGQESKQELADNLGQIGAELIVKHLPAILDGTLTPSPQDDTKATYDNLINKSDGLIDWTKPAHHLEREIRAYLGWPGSSTTIQGVDMVITRAHLDAAILPANHRPGSPFLTPAKKLAVVCGENTTLVIDAVKPAGKREMTSQEFLAGHPLS